MITPINQDSVIYLYATYAVDEERLRSVQPALPAHPTSPELYTAPDGYTRWLERQSDTAYRMDAYQGLRQLSFMQNNGYTHIILRPGDEDVRDWNEPGTVPGIARLWFVGTESLMYHRFWAAMNSVVSVPPGPIVAGWNIRNDLWPRLVVGALRHGIKVDQVYLHDPMSRYSTVKMLLDVADIYLQGVYPGLRRMPELTDALELFGVQQVCPVNPIVDGNTLARYTATDWEQRGHLQVTNLLYGMQSLLRQYYA